MVIADGEGPIGIAGIMGGKDSGVKDSTKTIVLEGANFEGPAIRHTSKRLNLRTEASTRFEKGLDPELAKIAIDRACQLAEQIGAATVVGGSYDIYEEQREPLEVVLRPERSNKLLGIEMSKEEMKDILERLEIPVTEVDGNLKCEIPSFRRDITIEADLIEEIGRFYGLNNIKPTEIYAIMTRGSKPYFRSVQKSLKETIKGIGYNEILTYSFISPSTYDKLMIPENDNRRENVRIMNPLGEEYSVMRTTLLGNMLDVISKNQNKNVEEMSAYEIGNTFSPEKGKDGIPTEGLKFVLATYGETDFYFVKETLEKILKELGINNYKFERETENTIYHPGRCANVLIQDEYIGTIGEIHPHVMENYDLKSKTIAGELDFNKIVNYADEKRTFKQLPKYPASERDLAILVDEEIMISQIKEIAQSKAGELLEDFKVFDIYTGEQIEKGKKSIAFNMKFRSLEKTLKDEEVNEIIENIISTLKEEINAILRD